MKKKLINIVNETGPIINKRYIILRTIQQVNRNLYASKNQQYPIYKRT